MTAWNGVELRARREALGLNQQQLAALLKVSQSILSHWETGAREPRDPDDVRGALVTLEEIEDDLFNKVCDAVEIAAEATADSAHAIPEVDVRTYLRDEDFQAADARARQLGLPAVLHRVAVAKAAKCLREEGTAIVHIIV